MLVSSLSQVFDYTETFNVSPSPWRGNTVILLPLGHRRFLSNPLQFVILQSACQSTLRKVLTGPNPFLFLLHCYSAKRKSCAHLSLLWSLLHHCANRILVDVWMFCSSSEGFATSSMCRRHTASTSLSARAVEGRSLVASSFATFLPSRPRPFHRQASERLECTTAVCILHHLHCLWSAFTGLYAKLSR